MIVLLTAWLPSGCVAASEQKAAMAAGTAKPAFCWPLAEFRYSLNRPTGGWLAPRGRASQHIGVDMFTAIGQPVRAIADGAVYDISESGWGSGNVAIMVKHRLPDGRWFIALYGHVRNIFGLHKGSKVQGCRAIATVGPYRCGSHVHLGIIAPGRFPHAPYGTCKKYNHNNFINPVHFLQTGQPEEPGTEEAPEEPLAGEQEASAAAPLCAGQNLAEGSAKDDLLEDILSSTDEQAAPADKAKPHLHRKKGRHHEKTAKLSKKERGKKKAVVRSAKGKAKKLQAKKGRTKHAVSAPARKQPAAKHQSGKAKGQQTKQKARKPCAAKRAARKR